MAALRNILWRQKYQLHQFGGAISGAPPAWVQGARHVTSSASVAPDSVVQAAIDILSGMENAVKQIKPKDYTKVDKLVEASVGQHFRHSLDHLQKCIGAMAGQRGTGLEDPPPAAPVTSDMGVIHYDVRARGGKVETDPQEALGVITQLKKALQAVHGGTDPDVGGAQVLRAAPVSVAFMLTGDRKEYVFNSNLERELWFCCHHSIHHNAMAKLILKSLGHEVPPDFGLAPSTAAHKASV